MPELAPRAELRIVIGPGVWVIFDHAPGAYQAGTYAALVVISQQEINDKYVAPARAADSCDELGQVIGNLYATYADEVRLLPIGGFDKSPLSMIDDLRFGAAIHRLGVLGCNQQEVELDAQTVFCATHIATDSAAELVYDKICDAGS